MVIFSRFHFPFRFSCYFVFALLSCSQTLLALQEIVVTAEVEGKPQAGMPIKGTLTITHDSAQKVDEKSFRMEGKPIKIEFIKDVQLSPNSSLVISIYQFILDPHPVGLQALAEISVNVGGKMYHTITSTYEIEQTETQKVASTGLVLKLETIIDQESSFYPGQRTIVGYRYSYNYSVDLIKEELPLFEAKGFRKIGGKESKTSTDGEVNHLDVTQIIEAVAPGNYFFPPAHIVGRAYTQDRFGQKNYSKTELAAETEPLTITVLPFPEQGKPGSFNGAIGELLSFETSILSSSQLAVGDKLLFVIMIKGAGELSTLPMPAVCCQPGFSGFFKLSDLPPDETLSGDVKTFKVELRPLTDKIKEIPPLEFSYFNPNTKKYAELKSQAIPITVIPMQAPITSQAHPSSSVGKGIAVIDETPPTPQLIEIEGNLPLIEADLDNKPFGTWWVLVVIPLGIGGLLLQMQIRHFLIQKKGEKSPENSYDLFRKAINQDLGSASFFQYLNSAFILRLYERGEIANPDTSIDHLPVTGAAGDVRAFLKEIEVKRFSGKEGEFGPEFIARAKALFKELKNGNMA